MSWMTGTVSIEPEVETERREVFGQERDETSVQFLITREEIDLATNKRIFLSHKGVDKPIVRRIYDALSMLGFEPRLDEADMNAGVELERALIDGMRKSCAAVFFITPNYRDDNFLASEVDYAVSEKRLKKNNFSIITLKIEQDKVRGDIPDLLHKYVWKEPTDELDMLTVIVKALPICVGEVHWRKESVI